MAPDIQALDLQQPQVAEALHAIWLAAYAQEASLLGIPAALFPPLQCSAVDLQACGWTFLGAMTQGALAGALALETRDGATHINSLVVAPECQRRGLGRQLMAAALQRCQGQKLRVSTGAANTPAVALYQSMGFVPYLRETVGPPPVELVRLERLA